MDAGDLRGNAPKRSAGGPAGLGIPGLELARRAAQPEEDAVLLRFLRFLRENAIVKKPRETRDAGQGAAGQSFQEQPAMQPVLIGAAVAGKRVE